MKRFDSKPCQPVVRPGTKSFGTRPMFGTSLYDGTYNNELSSKALLKDSYDDSETISPAYDPKQSVLDVGEVVGESTE